MPTGRRRRSPPQPPETSNGHGNAACVSGPPNPPHPPSDSETTACTPSSGSPHTTRKATPSAHRLANTPQQNQASRPYDRSPSRASATSCGQPDNLSPIYPVQNVTCLSGLYLPPGYRGTGFAAVRARTTAIAMEAGQPGTNRSRTAAKYSEGRAFPIGRARNRAGAVGIIGRKYRVSKPGRCGASTPAKPMNPPAPIARTRIRTPVPVTACLPPKPPRARVRISWPTSGLAFPVHRTDRPVK